MTTTVLRVGAVTLFLALTGCDPSGPPRVNLSPNATSGQNPDFRVPEEGPPEYRPLSREVEQETVGNRKRLKVKAVVCLRELGAIGLECLLCLAPKQHESILKTNVHPEAILEGLKGLGATPGSPPEYVRLETGPGALTDVTLRYEQAGKVVKVPTKWTAPPEQPLQFIAEYVKDGQPQPVPVTGEAPAATRVTAWLSYNQDGKFVDLPKVSFQAPAGPPIKVGLELNQQGKATVIPALYKPATGTPIKVTLQYEKNGKQVTEPAGRWLRNGRTQKDLDLDFVLAGSVEFRPEGGPPALGATIAGGLICVCDVPDALLSLAVWSPKGRDARFFEPVTDRIPPIGHPVTVILEPILDGK
jgi:hypothetical protein